MRSRIKQWLLDKATLLFLLVFYRTTTVERKQLKLLDEPVCVYEFESESDAFAQVTHFNTIIWNRQKVNSLSKSAKRLVLRHEMSHRDRNPVFKGIFYGTTLWLVLGAILTVGGITSIAMGGYSSGTTLVGTGMLLMIVFGVCYRADETLADYHTLKELGESEFIFAYAELSGQSDNSFITKLIRTLFYTNPKNTIALRRAISAFST